MPFNSAYEAMHHVKSSYRLNYDFPGIYLLRTYSHRNLFIQFPPAVAVFHKFSIFFFLSPPTSYLRHELFIAVLENDLRRTLNGRFFMLFFSFLQVSQRDHN